MTRVPSRHPRHDSKKPSPQHNMQRVSIGLIGCGTWGINHLRVWSSLGYLGAVCDPRPDRLRVAAAENPHVELLSDVDQMLRKDDITAVVIATPAHTHSGIAHEALQAGKDVLIEKPMALTVAEGERLVQSAHQLGRILMVGHVIQYHPAVRKLQELIDHGTLGRIQYLYSNRLNFGAIRMEESALWSFAPHDIALILAIMKSMPEEVTCHGGAFLNHKVADVTLTALRFSNNVSAHIHVSWLHPFKEQRFVVVGERMMAVFEDTRPWPEKLALYPHNVSWLSGQVPVANKAEVEYVDLPEVEPLREECEHFVQCIQNREQPLTDGPSAIGVLRLLASAEESLERGGTPTRVAVQPIKPLAYYAHPTAVIDSSVDIGEGTNIWHYTHVMSGAKIGRRCSLGQNVFVGRNVRIGSGVKVQNNVSIYEGVELEDDVFCGPSMVFTNVKNPRSAVDRRGEYRKTLVRRGATLGANCTVICGVTLGGFSFVAAGAVVTKDVPDYGLVTGVPGRLVGWICECGEKLEFKGRRAGCLRCGRSYVRSQDNEVELMARAELGAAR